MPRKTPAEPVPNRLPEALRRRMRIGGLSLLATTGLLGTYIGYPGLRRAYAVTTCEVTNNDDSATLEVGELRYCLDQVNTPGGGTITIRPDIGLIALNDDLDPVTASGTFTIRGAGQGNTRIDGQGHSAFQFTHLSSTVYVSDLTIYDTYVSGNGAALNAPDSTVTLDNVTFRANYSTGGGGAVYANELTVRDSTFSDNNTHIYTGGNGGALFSVGDLNIEDSRFIGNTSGNWGGAAWVDSGEVDIRNTEFSTNYANYGYGGAVASYGTSVEIAGSTFSGNRANNGGALYSFSNASITSSTFSNNTASGSGGAVSGAYSTPSDPKLTVTNSTFAYNEALYSGAINWYYDAELNFVTVTGNTSTFADPRNPATYVEGDLSLKNSILFGNINGSGYTEDLDVRGDLTASHILLTSNSSFRVNPLQTNTLTGVIYGDPLLGSLTNNGGPVVANTGSPTLTMMPAADSPVIGMADPTGAPAFDQRGFTRTTNGLADMGAVERRGRPQGSDPSQIPPSWFQATTRTEQSAACPPGMHASWAEWPNEHTGGWTCEWTTWWDVNNGMQGGWVTTPGFNPGRPVSE